MRTDCGAVRWGGVHDARNFEDWREARFLRPAVRLRGRALPAPNGLRVAALRDECSTSRRRMFEWRNCPRLRPLCPLWSVGLSLSARSN
jgi:hypothetical protein